MSRRVTRSSSASTSGWLANTFSSNVVPERGKPTRKTNEKGGPGSRFGLLVQIGRGRGPSLVRSILEVGDQSFGQLQLGFDARLLVVIAMNRSEASLAGQVFGEGFVGAVQSVQGVAQQAMNRRLVEPVQAGAVDQRAQITRGRVEPLRV